MFGNMSEYGLHTWLGQSDSQEIPDEALKTALYSSCWFLYATPVVLI